MREYVDAAVADMSGGLYATGTDWDAALADALPELYAQNAIAGTHPGLDELVGVAGGLHSRLDTPAEAAGNEQQYAPAADFQVPSVTTTDGIGIVILPAFNGGEAESVDRYQDAGIEGIRAAAEETTCGWIIDLRTNSGGNVFPMLSTIAPMLTAGRVFGLEDRDGATEWMTVENGALQSDLAAVPPATPDFTIDQPVAILTGDLTASAAEAVVVAFHGQAQTARFGAPTAGLTTGNERFWLEDGAKLIVTTSYYVDREGTMFNGPIAPDVPVDAWKTPAAQEAASAWLRTQCNEN